MRASKLSTLVVSALAVLALATPACKKKSETTTVPACTKAQLDEACSIGADCCSGRCAASGTCVASDCGAIGAICGGASDCCQAACSPTLHECVDPGSCGAAIGESCNVPENCCSGFCEGASGSKVCTSGGGGCHLLSQTCTGTTAADKNASCCSGFCNPSNTCAVPPISGCVDDGGVCNGDSQCCSKVCTAGRCEPVAGTCLYEGDPCSSDAQCCGRICPNAGTPGATCSSAVCLQLDQPCSPTNNLCCSGVCGFGSKCVPPPAGDTGQTCATLNEACAYAADCCSKNCQGASGGLKNGTCMPVASCNAFGDVCYRSEDCCSGLCSNEPGQAGRCDDAPGGCGQDGYPCTSDSGCCTKRCVDLGTGAKACQPSGGCRLNGNYCDTTDACCNVNFPPTSPSQYVECDPVDHVCDNGGSCNPPGDICGLNASASQNCCYGKKDVCKYDMNGIPRCFGGCMTNDCSQGPCPTGWDGNDPQCCIPAGDICQFRDQCCGLAPCVPDAQGVLRCTEPPTQCLPSGARCSTAPPPPQNYTPVQGECCDGSLCRYVGEIGWVCAKEGGSCTAMPGDACTQTTQCCVGFCLGGTCESCKPNGATCTSEADCCSSICDASGICRPPCQPENDACTVTADCCSGLTCVVPPGSTSGTCKGDAGPVCGNTGQACSTVAPIVGCCNAADTCTNGVCTAPVQCKEPLQACTAGGNECCTGLSCLALDAVEGKVACGSQQAVTACFCDVVSCAPMSQPCSTLVPCCTGFCGDANRQSCTSTNPADCTCWPLG
ncbi:MAG TPA: hypothetical protein VFL83_21090 [Anaeromyxobacter sp.]|nr:hypothetical protein [Anaeromyxobacter sp.]